MTVLEFEEFCQKVYFPTEDYSLAQLVLVNGGLYYLFLEYSAMCDDQQARNEYTEHYTLARANFETSLHRFDITVESTYENCNALLLGVRIISTPIMFLH